jgi:uncharacterized protein
MLTPAECQIIIDTLMPFEPTYIGIFGSVARGDDTPESDVDILTDFTAKNLRFADYLTMQDKLYAYLKRPIDLVDEKGARKWLLEEVAHELQLIYGQKDISAASRHR